MKEPTRQASAMAVKGIQEANSISLGPAKTSQLKLTGTAPLGDVVKETEILTETMLSLSGLIRSRALSQPERTLTRISCSGWRR